MLLEYNVKTNLSYEETISVLEQKIADIKFGVLCKIDLAEKIKSKGLDFNEKLTIFEICNPIEARNALQINIKASYFLPCKLIVREENGKAIVSMMKPSGLIRELDDPELEQLAGRIEDTLISVMDDLS
jgi:uncharacterized protein (DUF302 family)